MSGNEQLLCTYFRDLYAQFCCVAQWEQGNFNGDDDGITGDTWDKDKRVEDGDLLQKLNTVKLN